jgi:coproporphyrinogen III oxidase-like Fe-S oxidoreductase
MPNQLLNSRYDSLASNTIDYWMLPDDPTMTYQRVEHSITNAPVLDDATLQLYVHVPFCAQRCRFCAFSGGNDLDFKQAERYSRLVIAQTKTLLDQVPVKGYPILSINIGGGSPDLVGSNIGYMLKELRDLPGCNDKTEISIEFTLSTTGEDFIDELVRYNVTKASFGIQSLDPKVRKWMRQPVSLQHYEKVLNWIDGRIPVVNADLITGMPGQTLKIMQSDLQTLMNDRRINAISSYLLTPGAAPALLAAVKSGDIPAMPSHEIQALMRLQTYGRFLRRGWVRRGTNTYFDPSRMTADTLEMIAGNECIGGSHYEAFLIGAGPQAISYFPGARVENHVNVKTWADAVENGDNPFHLAKCNDIHQYDTALWAFPLRWEGLPRYRLDRLLSENRLTQYQLNTISQLQDEGLIIDTDRGLELSILGEVFMGRLVRDLKSDLGRKAVDDYIAEGHALGQAIVAGTIADENQTNNRQLAEILVNSKIQ